MQSLTGYIILLLLLALPGAHANGQEAKKTLSAGRVATQITIDGRLDEPVWTSAAKATDFIQYGPNPGDPARQRTEVSILYDDDAVYIGAFLHDTYPDSILRQLSARDDDGGNTDIFYVYFDTYYDKQNATEFSVTAAGVQIDAIVKFDGRNPSWNAAWYSKVSISEKGWCVEMKIPYSAIRFSKAKEQVWGVNFQRSTRRYRERSYWSSVSPVIPNALNQEGMLTGIHDIKSPVRLAFLPYVSGYAENYDGTNAQTLNGGMDIKYGVSESFTIDMTLVPDFGQTIYDNRVLNLSPIEVRYNENRYFFTEGLDLFNKNDLFYSRRVGGTPVNSPGVGSSLSATEVVTKNPATTKLYNATKVSGRTRGKLGIGFFNAVSEPAYATILDTASETGRRVQTAPLTNYNVVVLDQALKNNSYISLINTNVWRQENSYNADVTALLFKFANKRNSYGINGSGDVSHIYAGTKPDIGYRYYLNVGKISGNYTWQLSANTISDRFNPNDLGYLDRNNISYYHFQQYYNIYQPVGRIMSAYNHFGISHTRVFNPDVFRTAEAYGSHNVTFRNFLTVGFYWTLQPFSGNDYNEPRTFGRFYVFPKNYMAGGFYSSDYRKKFALDLELTNRWFAERQRNSFSWGISPRYRFSNKFSAIYNLNGQHNIDDVGFVDKRNDSIFLGIRHLNTITNALNADYIFTSRMSLSFSARHYWSQARYSQYAYLQPDGLLAVTPSYNTNKNINFNTFNIYMSFVWQFRPGSEMTIVYQNSIYSTAGAIETDYFLNFGSTLSSPQSNSLSVKIIYYLDYLYLRKALHHRA